MSLIDATWLDALRARSSNPRFAAARQALADRVAFFPGNLPEHPVQMAGYYHDFFCPEHAVQLIFDPHQPHRHVCPTDGKVFSGEPFDAAWRWSVNDILSEAALKYAVNAALIDDAEAAKAQRAESWRILSTYAERYTSMQPPVVPHPSYNGRPGHPGVVCWSALDEDVWIIRVAWAYALLVATGADELPDGHRELIHGKMLRPGLEHLWKVRWDQIHNVQVWSNAAFVTLALELGDDTLVDKAIDWEFGVDAQLREGLLADGSWWEGSLSYHYYTMAAWIWTVRALRAAGKTFSDPEKLKTMFTAPLLVALPDLTLPAVNDCWFHISLTGEVGHGIPDAAGFYEVAYGWYEDPMYAWVLGLNAAKKPLQAFESLLDGAPSVPAAEAPHLSGDKAAEAGLATLRTTGPRETQIHALLKAGPFVKDHGHPDQLALQLTVGPDRFALDLGTAGYGIDLNESWYRQTGSHASVLIDGETQPLTAATMEHADETSATGSVTWDEGVYAGVTMRRSVQLGETYLLDVFEVDAPESKQIDFVLPFRAAYVDGPVKSPAEGVLPSTGGYEHYRDVERFGGSDAGRLRWKAGETTLSVYVPAASEERYLATGPGNPAHDRLSILLRRATGTSAVFASVIATDAVTGVRWLEDGVVEIETVAGLERKSIGGSRV